MLTFRRHAETFAQPHDTTVPNDDDGCMNPHNAPGCYVQQLHAFCLSQHIPMLNLIKKIE